MSNILSIRYIAESDETNPIAWVTEREGPKADARDWLLRAFGGFTLNHLLNIDVTVEEKGRQVSQYGAWSESRGCRIIIEGTEAISFSFFEHLSFYLRALGFTIVTEELIDQEN